MDEKISLGAVDHYSEQFSAKIIAGFFASKEKITGPEITALCEIEQVNRFVISALLHSWKGEIEKLKSPYFNYNAPEVSEALSIFQNILSNNISISQTDFRPLFEQAVSQTLYVLLAPYDYYSDILERQGQGLISVSNLKNEVKYLKINQAPLQSLIQKLENKKITAVPRNEVFAMLDTILEEVNFTPADIENYILQFSKVIPLQVEKLFGNDVTENKSVLQEQKAPAVISKPEPVVQKTRPEPAVNKPRVQAANGEKNGKSVADNLHRIIRIKDSLTINQKFMFTKILFHGDFEIFSQAIDRIDMMDNLSQALRYLEDTYPEWDIESSEYVEFQELLEKRFS